VDAGACLPARRQRLHRQGHLAVKVRVFAARARTGWEAKR
jgi:hypothetical protein